MKHSHMAVGQVPESLVNLAVVVQWTPGYRTYILTILDGNGVAQKGLAYECKADEPFDGDLSIHALDMSVYHGLNYTLPLPARLAQSLAGFGYFQWYAPADMPGKAREKFEKAVSQ